MSAGKDNSKAFLKSFSRTEPVQVALPYDGDLYPLLLNEYGIIHLLYHRSLNQHHVACWWSHLDILHRHVRKILLLMEDIDEIRTLRRLTSVQWNAPKKTFVRVNEFPQMVQKRIVKKIKQKNKNKKVEKFIMLHKKMTDAAAVTLINKKISLLLKEAKYLYKRIIPSSYWIFMGVIELAQFVNIGFVLIGFVSRIWSLLQKIEGFNLNSQFQQTLANGEKKAHELKKQHSAIVEPVTEVDIGEAIDVTTLEESVFSDLPCAPSKEDKQQEPKEKDSSKRKSNDIIDDLFGSFSEKKVKKQKKEKKKEKKKKVKNAIDDIFGF